MDGYPALFPTTLQSGEARSRTHDLDSKLSVEGSGHEQMAGLVL
jgi:hypothetical protein